MFNKGRVPITGYSPFIFSRKEKMELNNYDFKPNSHAYKMQQKKEAPVEEKKKIEKVVTKGVKTKKKNEFRKFLDGFISEDVPNIKSYIITDVVIPAIKDLLEDVVTNGIRMFLRGEVGSRRKSSTGSKVSYRSFYEKESERRPSIEPRTRNGFDYEELIIENRGEAEAVLDQMYEVINRYGFVAVSDLYDMVDMTAPYTSNKYGWIDLRGSKVIPVRDGYVLKLPKPVPLD